MLPAGETNPLGKFPGSVFGMIQGFTQRGWTGFMSEADGVPEPEGLKASAVAVALTPGFEEGPSGINEKTRATKVGRFACCTCTITTGIPPKLDPKLVQSVLV